MSNTEELLEIITFAKKELSPYAEEQFNEIADIIREHETMRWISINDRLPEDAESYHKKNEVYPKYLVMRPGSALPRILCFDGHNFCNGLDNFAVTHWMPLPNPPKDTKENT
jgi:hypothetical protein